MPTKINLEILRETYGEYAIKAYNELVILCENLESAGEEIAILTHFLETGVKHPEVPEAFYSSIPQELDYDKKFEFIDLFAGIGGFRLALSKLGGRCVFSSEWEKNAQSTYFRNFKVFPFGDINRFTDDNVSDNQLGSIIPSHDLLTAGFPCQPFSLAGVSARNSLGQPHGFECNTQGTLFRSIERIAAIKQPKLMLLENVRNIISHDRGKTFEIIQKSIENAGYKFFYKLVNSETVVAQRRIRCFMVCVRNDLHREFGDFDFPNFDGAPLPLSSIIREKVEPKYTISDQLWEGHKKRSKRNRERGTGFTTGVADLDKPSNTIVARYGKDGKECLIPQKNSPPRMLSIEECRDLFGYPNDFNLPSAKTTTYRLLGNSVVVPVVRSIAIKLLDQYLN